LNVFAFVRGGLFAGIAVFAFSAFAACELAVDLAPLDVGCPSGQKACVAPGETVKKCVDLLHPSTGCAGLSCQPCTTPHATARCGGNGQCLVAACDSDYKDCYNGDPDGCETNVKFGDPNNCGDCGRKCDPVLNGEPDCGEGTCKIKLCNPGFDDCNGDQKSCETDLMKDKAHCGKCTTPCMGATPNCVDGKCAP
jgi:hypothetical protein